MKRLETASFISCRGVIAALLTVAGLLLVSVSANAAVRPGAPVPAAAATTSQAGLSGVSCSSANACMAVGSLLKGSPVTKGFSLAESWNGKTWTMKATPNPRRATNSNLYAVSCSGPRTCLAVGMYEDAAAPTGVPFSEAWNGKTWTVKTAPKPKGGTNSGLYAVSCISAHYCIAVGNTIRNTNNNVFSERWNGKSWAIKATPRPRRTTYSNFGSVSCRSAAFCTAVGQYQAGNSSKSRTLAEVWNGKAWRIEATPNPKAGANGAGLSGVSCSSLRACLAVGGYDSPANHGLTLAEAWNGRTWTIKAARNPKGATGSELAGVSCRAANACTAIGADGNGLFAELWNGKTWTVKAVPRPRGATFTSLTSVSCRARDACAAVGSDFGSSQAERPLAEAWNGKTWTTRTVPF